MAVRDPHGPAGRVGGGRALPPGEALLRVQYRLTDRDLILLGWLADHGTLTTDQIAHALYPSLDFAQRRLLKLTRAGLTDRFRPQRADGGSHPYHYVLAQLGAQVVAAQRDDDELPRPDRARKRRWWLTNRANLPHLLAVNQFFIDLAGHARTHPGTALERWWPSARCQQHGTFLYLSDHLDMTLWKATIAADGHGIWTTTRPDGTTGKVPFFVEVDLSTEDLTRLAGKITSYETWSRTTGRTWPVLFWLASPTREAHLQQRLHQHPAAVPVATAVRDQTHLPGASPAGRVWWLHRADHWLAHPPDGHARLALGELPTHPPDERTKPQPPPGPRSLRGDHR